MNNAKFSEQTSHDPQLLHISKKRNIVYGRKTTQVIG